MIKGPLEKTGIKMMLININIITKLFFTDSPFYKKEKSQ